MSWNPNSIDGGGPRPEPVRPLNPQEQLDEAMLSMLSGFLSNSRVMKPAAAKMAVQEMDLIIFDNQLLKKYPDPCTICAEPYKLGDEAKKFPCKHVFHEDCILQWLEKNNSCPLCRFELPTLDHDYDAERRMKEAREKQQQQQRGQAGASSTQTRGQNDEDEYVDDEEDYDKYLLERRRKAAGLSNSSMYS